MCDSEYIANEAIMTELQLWILGNDEAEIFCQVVPVFDGIGLGL